MWFLIALALASPVESDMSAELDRIRDCGTLQNCVSTTHDPEDARRYIEPFSFEGDPAEALQRLKAIVQQMPRTEIVEQDDHYLHVTFTTLILRFTDDVEFLVEPEGNRIHFRSASRVGKSDLGVNRKRMEQIRTAWVEAR